MDEILKEYRFSANGNLMVNFGTEKRPRWFPVAEDKYLIELADKCYKKGFSDGQKAQVV